MIKGKHNIYLPETSDKKVRMRKKKRKIENISKETRRALTHENFYNGRRSRFRSTLFVFSKKDR